MSHSKTPRSQNQIQICSNLIFCCFASPTSSYSKSHRKAGGRPSLFHFTLLLTHSTASSTPVPLNALTGNTLLSRILAPFSPSNTLFTKPSLILTTSTQSSRSCLFANTNNGTPSVSLCCNTSSRTNLHSSSLLLISFALSVVGECTGDEDADGNMPSPISVESIMNTMA